MASMDIQQGFLCQRLICNIVLLNAPVIFQSELLLTICVVQNWVPDSHGSCLVIEVRHMCD